MLRHSRPSPAVVHVKASSVVLHDGHLRNDGHLRYFVCAPCLMLHGLGIQGTAGKALKARSGMLRSVCRFARRSFARSGTLGIVGRLRYFVGLPMRSLGLPMRDVHGRAMRPKTVRG